MRLIDRIRAPFAWKPDGETWAAFYERNSVTGEVRRIRKVRGVFEAPAPREGAGPPPRPNR